jgi:Flp pilus assembly protein TadD
MCRKLVLAATSLIAVAAAPLMARAADAPIKPVAAAPAAAAAPTPPKKATPAQRAEAERLDPLARAAFWAHEAEIDPNDAEAGVRLSSALRALGQFPEAIQNAQKVLVLQPENAEALMELARAYVAEGQGFYAVDPAKHAASINPRDWRPLSLLGVAYAQVERDADARAAWAAALTLSPDNPAVLSNQAMDMAAHGDAPGAEALLRRAVAQPGATLQERDNLTLVLGLEGKLTEAETLLRQDQPPEQADASLAYLQAVSPQAAASAPAKTPAATAPEDAAHTWKAIRDAGG